MVGALLSGGCANDFGGSPGAARGELGLATFEWRCSGPGDNACSQETFIGAAARGAEFRIRATPAGSLPSKVKADVVATAGADLVTRLSTEGPYTESNAVDANFLAEQEGTLTLMLLSQRDEVIDYTHVRVAEVDHLTLRRLCADPGPVEPSGDEMSTDSDGDASGTVRLTPGGVIMVRAEPRDSTGLELVGQLEYTWESTDPTVASLSAQDGNEIRLETHKVGDVEIVVTAGGVEGRFWFQARGRSEGPKRRRPGEDTGGTSDGTTGTGGTTGSDTDASTSGGMQ